MLRILKGKGRLLPIVAAAIIVVAAFGACFYGINETASAASDITVVLDAGHGGIDGGVRGKITGTDESVINLAVVKKTQANFQRAGINCVLTRSTDAGLYGALSKGFKKRDMQRRKEIIEEAKPVAVVSVHQNFYSSSAARGGHVFYRKDSGSGKLLAGYIQKELDSLCGDDRKPLTGDYFMLNCTQYASVIVECGFLSNEEDEKLLMDESYREKLAYAIFTGVIEYISVPSVS